MFADISVVGYGKKDNATFTYRVSGCDNIAVGSLVRLRFGKKSSLGVIRKLYSTKPSTKFKISPIGEVVNIEALPKPLLDLADWLVDYYVATQSSVWQLMLPRNPTTKPRKVFDKSSLKPLPLVELSEAQKNSLNAILKSSKPCLLEGAMGSGKTEIYFHLIANVLKNNKSAILLMPEIFLTTQMIERARKHFGNKLLVTHSAMTPAQRRAFWVECNSRSKDEGLVVLGPRSGLFAPLNNLGLIIVDECHEQSYKQDASPRYLTEYVAAKLASLTKSMLVLGSATPSVTTRYMAEAGRLTHVKLPDRAINSMHPDIKLVELAKLSEILSSDLQDKLTETMGANKSSLLYINRRGNAPVFMCNDCGQSFSCPRCNINLHLHTDTMSLICHVCDYREVPPAKCPNCDGTNLRGVGIGTKEVEVLIRKIFPKASVIRIDKDSAKSNDYREVFAKQNNYDVIIGTQMIGRGIDLHNLHLVGVINADYDLVNIDYNSLERAFQLISQTAGRAGRRDTRGEVIIQSKTPQGDFFDFIKANDFDAFYKSELGQRKKYSYPPYSYLLKLECGYKSKSLAKLKCQQLLASLSGNAKLQILGPVPTHPHIKNGKYFWKLIIKSKSRTSLVEVAKKLDNNWILNLDPYGIS